MLFTQQTLYFLCPDNAALKRSPRMPIYILNSGKPMTKYSGLQLYKALMCSTWSHNIIDKIRHMTSVRVWQLGHESFGKATAKVAAGHAFIQKDITSTCSTFDGAASPPLLQLPLLLLLLLFLSFTSATIATATAITAITATTITAGSRQQASGAVTAKRRSELHMQKCN